MVLFSFYDEKIDSEKAKWCDMATQNSLTHNITIYHTTQHHNITTYHIT